jgi:hypothetical protein
VAGVIALAAWLGVKFRPRAPATPPAGDASLLLLVHLTGPDGAVDRHRLLRVPFTNGAPAAPETVWEGPPGLFNYPGADRVINDRYVVTTTGCVIDVWEHNAIHDGGDELIEVTDDRVVYRVRRPEGKRGIFAFDLRTRKTERLAALDEGPYGLPGKRPPDGTKSVKTIFHALTFHRVGHPPRELGWDFRVEQSRLSSNRGNPPVLWLDNDRFLTQNGNGKLITVALDDTRTPVVEVPAKTEVIGAPHLSRDADGRIVYECGQEGFLIDVEAKTWERREWGALGHGFDASSEPDWRGRYVIRHRGEEVGRLRGWPHNGGHTAATNGYVAIIDERLNGIQVWSSATGRWTALDTRGAVVGWIK